METQRGEKISRSAARASLPLWAALGALSGCSRAEGGEGTAAAEAIHLEAWFDGPDGLLGEASYKVEHSPEGPAKELKVDLEHAQVGTRHALAIDGFELGQLTTDLDGEAEFELAGDDAKFLPAGCPELKVGSVIRVGELMELELKPLERVMDLETVIAGPGKLAGKVTFKFERLGDAISKDFQVKVTGAPPDSTHPVTLAGVAVGDLVVKDDGKGKLELSSRRRTLPAGFVDPAAGAALEIGTLYSGVLAAHTLEASTAE